MGYLRYALLSVPLLLAGCAEDGKCVVEDIGDLPVLTSTGVPIVRAELNDHPVAFIFDTGAIVSTIWPKQVKKLNMASQFAAISLVGAGGNTTAGVAVAEKLNLGAASASHVEFLTAGDMLDGRMIDGLPVVGMLGGDVLSAYDLYVDLPDHRINLYRVKNCAKPLASWAQDYQYQPIKRYYEGHDDSKIVMHIKLNDKPIEAYLDSGAGRTLVSRDDALRAGVNMRALKTDHKQSGLGVDDEKFDEFMHQFSSVDIGGLHITTPHLAVADTGHTLLGADFFREQRVWVPRKGNAVYVQFQKDLPSPQRFLNLSPLPATSKSAGQ